MEAVLGVLQDVKQCVPRKYDFDTALRGMVPEVCVQVDKAAQGGENDGPIRLQRKGSEVVNKEGEPLFPWISQALSRAMEDTEAAGQRALKWAEDETSAIGGALLRWSLGGMDAAADKILAPPCSTAEARRTVEI